MHEIHKIYEYEVNSPEAVEDNFVTEDEVKEFKEIRITSDDESALYANGTGFFLEVEGKEVFPRNFDPKLLMAGVEVPGTQRFFPLLLDDCKNTITIKRNAGRLRFVYRHTNYTTPYKLLIHVVGLTDKHL